MVGQRRIDAVPDLLKALDHSDQTVRNAALIALGETVDLDRLSVLVAQVVAPKHPEDATVAQQALKAASIRMPDREACAAELATALQRARRRDENDPVGNPGRCGRDEGLGTLAGGRQAVTILSFKTRQPSAGQME